jgi:hypothetical protein
MNVFQTRLHLDVNSERGNTSQQGRGSHGSHHVAAPARRQSQQLFQNGPTVAEMVRLLAKGQPRANINRKVVAVHGANAMTLQGVSQSKLVA